MSMITKRKLPKRACIGCGELKDKKELLRIVRTPEGEFLLDTTGKKNGRGAYICRSAECMAKAIRMKSLEKSFHMPIPSETYEMLRKELKQLESEG